MKVLIVCSKNSGKIAPFITEQVEIIGKMGVETAYFTIEQRGWFGYLKSRRALVEKIKEFAPDIVHAHFGLSGLLANLQRRVPVVTTYHGSDINSDKVFPFSKISMLLSKFNIFVSTKNIKKAKPKHHYVLIPCGVDIALFKPLDKLESGKQMNLNDEKKYVLFAGAFNNSVKNVVLAKSAVNKLENIKLLELKGYTRQEVAMLMSAVDVCLMTSHTEGSPQFIKEAMACNCPIVTVDVGDVREVIGDTKGCYVCDGYTVEEVAEKLKMALRFEHKTNGKERVELLHYDNQATVKRIIKIYNKIIDK